jgi:ATP-dependent exoDNAse (exonuclease V) alpha subunit
MTFHKVQGKTVDKIILDINKRPGTQQRLNTLDFFGLYVGISRVQDSASLRILPPQPGKNFGHIKRLKCDPRLKQWIDGYSDSNDSWKEIEQV